ncbi:hypothetical protein [Streptomyces sp. NPDC004726]
MISEPELIDDGDDRSSRGGFGASGGARTSAVGGAPRTHGVFRPKDPGRRASEEPGSSEPEPLFPDHDEPPPRERPPLRAWLWGLSGAVAASALWAGGLYAYDVYGDHDPDVGKYRTSRSLCVDADLKALSAVHGMPESRSPTGRADEALDKANCRLSFAGTPDTPRNMGVGAEIDYELHRKTDPGPQFDASVAAQHAAMGADTDETSSLTRIEGLGERAYVAVHGGYPVLHVLDGQAVLSLSVNAYLVGEGGRETMAPDLSTSRPLLIEDMRALMKELQS